MLLAQMIRLVLSFAPESAEAANAVKTTAAATHARRSVRVKAGAEEPFRFVFGKFIVNKLLSKL
jgi:hypothetical protein